MIWIIGGMMSSKPANCLAKILGLKRLVTLNNGGKKKWKYFKTSELQKTGTKSYSYDVFPTFTKCSSIYTKSCIQSVENWEFFCHSDFTWIQYLDIKDFKNFALKEPLKFHFGKFLQFFQCWNLLKS